VWWCIGTAVVAYEVFSCTAVVACEVAGSGLCA
jgi:hypothetical protein